MFFQRMNERMFSRAKVFFLLIFIILATVLVFLPYHSAAQATAATDVPQAGPTPFPLDSNTSGHGLVVLTGGTAEHTSDLSVADSPPIRYSYMQGFTSNSQYMKWSVSVSATTTFHVWGDLSGTDGTQLTLSDPGQTPLIFSVGTIGWNKIDAGQITIPTGTSTLTLIRNSTSSSQILFRALELVPVSNLTAYQQAITDFQNAGSQQSTALSKAKYGIFLQYGAWGYPRTGSTHLAIDQQAGNFDVQQFVRLVQQTGAGFVIWSVSWQTFQIDAPIQSVNTILGGTAVQHQYITSATQYDLLGKVADALYQANIPLLFYYQSGVNTIGANGSTSWATAQNFPTSTFPPTGYGDRTTFFTNWKQVIAEIGNRYGPKLAGWLFDDGRMYYPANFEDLGAAARVGNANRLVSYNPYTVDRITDFQDLVFGEVASCKLQSGISASPGGNGVNVAGPQKGLLEHCMYKINQDWGVHSPNTVINKPNETAQAYESSLQAAIGHGAINSYNFMMYEDGSPSPYTIGVLQQIKEDIRGHGADTLINDNNSAITYTGSWSVSSGRGNGDYNDDVHTTSSVGSSFSLSFNGNYVAMPGPLAKADGSVDIYLDGVFQKTISTTLASSSADDYYPQQLVYEAYDLSSGSHILKGVFKGPGSLQIDAFLYGTSTKVDDTNASISYSNGWSTTIYNRSSYYGGTAHATTGAGVTAQYTFSGSRIAWYGIAGPDHGKADVYVDGVLEKTVDCYATQWHPQILYSPVGLGSGSHTIKIITRSDKNPASSDTYVEVDAFASA